MSSEGKTTRDNEVTFEYPHGGNVYVKAFRDGKYRFYRNATEIDVEEWNRDANKYQSMVHKEAHPFLPVRLIEAHRKRTLLKLARPGPSDVVLEVGCEAGFLSSRLAALCRKLICVDVDENMLALASKRVNVPNVSFVQSSVESLKVESGAADIVLCAEVLEHVLCPDVAARELVRVTKPGGRIVVSVPNDNFAIFLKRLLIRSGFSKLLGNLNPDLAMGHLHVFRRKTLAGLFERDCASVRVFRGSPFFLNLFVVVRPGYSQ